MFQQGSAPPQWLKSTGLQHSTAEQRSRVMPAGASLGNSDRGVQDQIFRQKGVVMERFFQIRAWHTLQLMTRDELKVITLERCHVFLFINKRNNQRQVTSTI